MRQTRSWNSQETHLRMKGFETVTIIYALHERNHARADVVHDTKRQRESSNSPPYLLLGLPLYIGSTQANLISDRVARRYQVSGISTLNSRCKYLRREKVQIHRKATVRETYRPGWNQATRRASTCKALQIKSSRTHLLPAIRRPAEAKPPQK